MKKDHADFYKNKKVLVAGGTGTIGIPLVKQLLRSGADVSVASMDSRRFCRTVFGQDINFVRKDLTEFANCLEATRGKDYVFNLVGIKGSVGIGESKVASYFVPMLWYQTNLMEAAFRNDVRRYLFVSSICAYPQSSAPKEEGEMWEGMPKQNDRFPGLAKRIGEIQAEAYRIEHGWDAVRIARPSNVYGPFDDFNPATAQVIPALISRALAGENPLKIWGDGSAKRDFIFSEDVAHWLLVILQKAPACVPVNLGSGSGCSIKKVAKTITGLVSPSPEIEWDARGASGDPVRILSMKQAQRLIGFRPITCLEEGIKKTMEWYLRNKELAHKKGERYYGK